LKYTLFKTNQFKRSYKKLKLTDNEDLTFIEIIYNLANGNKLADKYKDHQLQGNLKEFRECHIKPDLLLIYYIEDEILKLIDIGSHSQLFE
jgi:mRNA interferase YafQ